MKNWNVIRKSSIFRGTIAEILTESKHMADIFEEQQQFVENRREVSNWLMVETVMRL